MKKLNYTDRVRTLKKLRRALEEQRDAFRSYLVILGEQEQAIMESDAEELERSVELERTILRDILRVQRVVEPLASLYRNIGVAEARDIEGLEGSLTRLQGQVLRRNYENRRLLSEHVEHLRAEVHRLRMPNARAILEAGGTGAAAEETEASLIDLTA